MKKFLKYIFCFFIITFLTLGDTFAAGENCKIKDGTAPVLEEYITNLRKVITNISAASGKTDTSKGVVKDAIEVKEEMLRLFNLSITWSDYFSYFDFFVIYPIENEYIYEIWRDYNLLQQEGDGLEKYSKAIVSRGLTGIELKKADLCKGLDGKNCNLNDADIVSVISQLQSNNEKIKQLFRVNIIGRTMYETSSDFILVPDNFKKDFSGYYNKNTTSDCSELEGSFWDRAGKAMEKIEETFTKSSKGIENWKEALGYMGLTDNATMRSEEYERNLLKKELGRQGVSGNAANAILNNLERFNKEGFSGIWSNNFITNSFNFVVNSLGAQLDEFGETISQVFKSKSDQSVPTTKSIKELEETNKNIKTTKQVADRIKLMYEREVPSLKVQDTSNEKLISKIIEMHYNINQAIKSLDGATKIAEKVCNDQAQGLGKCSYK